jgi:hypothetical protein
VGGGGGTGGGGAGGAGHLGEREDEGGEHVAAHCGSGRHAMRRPNTLDDICKVVLTYADVC